MHQVKVYDDHPDDGGKLVGIIPPEELTFIRDGKNEPRKQKKKHTRSISCEFCGDPARVQLLSQTTCKKSVCLEKKYQKRRAGKEKIRLGLNGRK